MSEELPGVCHNCDCACGCPDPGDRIAALKAQVAALVGTLRSISNHGGSVARAHRSLEDCCAQMRGEADDAITADVQHLAALDAARRKVCEAANYYRGADPGDVEQCVPAYEAMCAALDELARLERANAANPVTGRGED